MTVQAIDYHTAGEPFRIISGIHPIPGATMLEKRWYAMQHLDTIRRLVVNEPRGHADMYGGFLTDPVSSDGHLGSLFFHNEGFSTACGHGTIALVTAALETGMVQGGQVAGSPEERRVILDVPSGRLETIARLEPLGCVSRVRFRNVPSYLEAASVEIQPDGLPPLDVAIAFGGAFYALVDVGQLGLHLEPTALPTLIAHGRTIKAAAERAHHSVHPLEPKLSGIYGVIFAETIESGRAEQPRRDVNVTVFANGAVDRSPCGSGTSARLAALYARRELACNEPLIHQSIIGSQFIGTVVQPVELAEREAVITEIEGSAWLTGYHTFILEPDDPLGTGFLLR
jgi:proline racemase